MCVYFMFLKKKSTLCSLHPYYVTEKSQLNQWLSTKLNKEEKKNGNSCLFSGLSVAAWLCYSEVFILV